MPLEQLQQGRYRLLRPLGSGSMGEVYLMDDTRISRQVAVKIIRGETTSFTDEHTVQNATRLFEREARAVARLNHPNILPLFDYGDEEVNGATMTYMVMPYAPDGSFADWLKEQQLPLPPKQAAHFLMQAADALQHAHDNNIIHQDVKPQNFLIRINKSTGIPDLLLADFGIAKLESAMSGASQAIRGTPIYMAPEQWEGHPVPATDQYALAVMMYYLLTGQTPFQGGPSQMMYKHMTASPMPPSTINPDLSQNVDAVLLQALAKRPENRFPSVSDFARTLNEALISDETTVGAWSLDTRTRAATRGTGAGAAQAMLAVSSVEARNGAYRVLTLPNGSRVQVYVPPGTQDGQVIRVRDQNIPSGTPLLLGISVIPEGNAPLPSGMADNGQATIASTSGIRNNPAPIILPGDNRPTTPDVYADRSAGNYGNYAQDNYQGGAGFAPPGTPSSPYNEPPRRSTGRTIFLIILILVLLFTSGGLIYYFAFSHGNGGIDYNATATANANAAQATNAAGTADANSTSTAQAQATQIGQAAVNATATANAQASATANAQASATAQANANATATANANATATAANAPVPLKVTAIDIAANPNTITGTACGSTVTIHYTATFHAPANNAGGTVNFTYSTDNGQSSTPGTVTFSPGQTTKDFTFSTTGVVAPDHLYPGTVIVMVTSPNTTQSTPFKVAGTCV